MNSTEATEAILKTLSSINPENKSVSEYKMRDWLVSRQRYWGAPIPALECSKCGWIAEPNLPVLLPDITSNIDLLKTGRPLANVPGF